MPPVIPFVGREFAPSSVTPATSATVRAGGFFLRLGRLVFCRLHSLLSRIGSPGLFFRRWLVRVRSRFAITAVIFLLLLHEGLAILLARVTVATSLLLILTMLSLLGLLATFLLSTFLQCRGEILQGTDKMDAKIAFGFMGFLNGLGNPLDGTGELFEGGVDTLEAGGDALEEVRVGIGFWSAHSMSGREWAHDCG